MLFCMRTTLDLEDDLMRSVKKRAAERGMTITRVIEDSLRESLARERQKPAGYRLKWRTVRGRLLPGVDLTDRDALFDRMEGRG
jgi:hypothetical protein